MHGGTLQVLKLVGRVGEGLPERLPVDDVLSQLVEPSDSLPVELVAARWRLGIVTWRARSSSPSKMDSPGGRDNSRCMKRCVERATCAAAAEEPASTTRRNDWMMRQLSAPRRNTSLNRRWASFMRAHREQARVRRDPVL